MRSTVESGSLWSADADEVLSLVVVATRVSDESFDGGFDDDDDEVVVEEGCEGLRSQP